MTIRDRIILDALESQLSVLGDFEGDEEFSAEHAQAIGADILTIKLVMQGLILEYRNLGLPPAPRTLSIQQVVERCLNRFLEKSTTASPPTEEVVSVTDTRQRTITRQTAIPAQTVPAPARKPVKALPAAKQKCSKHPSNTEFDSKGRCRQCARDAAKRNYDKKQAAKRAASGLPPQRRDHKPGPKPKPYVPALDDALPDDDDDTSDEHNDVELADDFLGVQLSDEDFDDVIIEEDDEPEASTPDPPVSGRRSGTESLEFEWSKRVRCPKCGTDGSRLRRMRGADLSKDYWLHLVEGRQPCTIKISSYQIKVDAKYRPDA